MAETENDFVKLLRGATPDEQRDVMLFLLRRRRLRRRAVAASRPARRAACAQLPPDPQARHPR